MPHHTSVFAFSTYLLNMTSDEVATERGASIACMSTPYLLAIGFALVFAALHSKLWRVNKLFSGPAMRRVKVTERDVIKPLCGLLLINILVLGLWTGLAPLTWERTVVDVDPFGNTVESLGQCTSDGALAYIITLAVVDLGAVSSDDS